MGVQVEESREDRLVVPKRDDGRPGAWGVAQLRIDRQDDAVSDEETRVGPDAVAHRVEQETAQDLDDAVAGAEVMLLVRHLCLGGAASEQEAQPDRRDEVGNARAA